MPYTGDYGTYSPRENTRLPPIAASLILGHADGSRGVRHNCPQPAQVRDRVARSSASGANPASICQAPQEVGRDQAHRSRYSLLVSRELINIIQWVMRQEKSARNSSYLTVIPRDQIRKLLYRTFSSYICTRGNVVGYPWALGYPVSQKEP
jgi:hypothetical protein